MEDFTCPLCLKLLYLPVSIPCGHVFCRYCLQQAYTVSQKCPICRAALRPPASLLETSAITNYLLKNFPEEVKQRENEEKSQGPVMDQVAIPVIFINNLILYPGAQANFNIFEPRYLMMVQTVMRGDRTIGVVSQFLQNTIGFSLEITSCRQNGNNYFISGLVKERLYLDRFFPFNSNEGEINVRNIGNRPRNDQVLWVALRNFKKDIFEVKNTELERELMMLTQNSLSKLSQIEYDFAMQNFDCSNDSTFFMLNLLKLNEKALIKAFNSVSFNKRLKIIQKFMSGKRPSKALLKLSSPNRISVKSSYVVLILSLLILYFTKNF